MRSSHLVCLMLAAVFPCLWGCVSHSGHCPHAAAKNASDAGLAAGDWREILEQRLTRYGHRNIIAVVDSAYPAQSKPGVEMVVTNADQLRVVREVLGSVAAKSHVRARIITDEELARVSEADAPGIGAYRRELGALLLNLPHSSKPHGDVIKQLDETSETFNVLLLKTNLTLPYTSVFVVLECGYWSDQAEGRLRGGTNP